MSEDKKFTCLECGRTYSYRRALRRHVLKVHPGKLGDLVPITRVLGNGEYLCSVCGKRFTTERFLKFHERNDHAVGSSNIKLNCPLCDISTASKKRLYIHLAMKHDLSIESEETEFESFEDFWVWKQQIERNTLSRYVKPRGSRCLPDNTTRHSFFCHRSGHFLSKGKGIRRRGTVKIDGICPSSIEVTEARDGSCKVKYVVTHIGHQNVDNHVTLTETERNEEESILAELSRENIEPPDISQQKEKMRQSFENLLDTISSAKQMEVLKRHLSSLNASLAAVDYNEDCQQIGPCNTASKREQNIQPQRRVLSTRKRRKIVHHLEKPCTTESQDIVSPLQDIPVRAAMQRPQLKLQYRPIVSVSDGVLPGGSKPQLPATQNNTLVPVINGVRPEGSKPRQLTRQLFILVPVIDGVRPGGSKPRQLPD